MASSLEQAAFATTREQLFLALGNGYRAGVSELPDKLSAIAAAVAAFSESGVPYALIGGLAVGVRSGVPRATLDVDFAIDSAVDRANLIALLLQRAFEMRGTFAHSINFSHDSGEPVQLAFDPSFDASIERAELMAFGALEIRVVTRGDLIAMKKQAAADPARRRSKALRDQADIALLEGDVPDPNEGW
jgi:Nucleotidyl transferase AbiEii toxin, Type IV TA system